MKVDIPTEDAINFCAIEAETLSPQQVAAQLEMYADLIKNDRVDILHGARLVAYINAAIGFLK